MILKRARRGAGKQGRIVPKGDIIYARPSFIRGVARLFDFGGTLNIYHYQQDEDPAEADARAIASDWEAVGKDIADAIEKYDASVNPKVMHRH